MSKNTSGVTVNAGPAPEPDRDEVGEVAGNVREKGQDPSPDDRDRGETSSADHRAPVDLDTVRDRAS